MRKWQMPDWKGDISLLVLIELVMLFSQVPPVQIMKNQHCALKEMADRLIKLTEISLQSDRN